MAYIDPLDPNNQQAQMTPNALLQTPQTAGQVSSGPAGGAASAVPPAGAAAQTSGGKAPPVQNLAAYLKANAPQAQGMADKIATKLGAGAKQVQSDMANAQSAFDTDVQTGSVQPDQGLIQQAAADPVSFVKDPNNVQAFQKQLNATYSGPQDFQGTKYYSDLNSKISSAVANAGSTDPKNIRQVVQKLETNPTAGMTALDALVLQQNPNAIGTVKNAQAPYATLNQALQDMVTQSNAKIQAAQAGTAAAPQAVKAAFDPLTQSFQQGLTAAQQKAEADRQAYNSAIAQIQNTLAPIQTNVNHWSGRTGLNLDSNPLTQYTGLSPVANPATMESVASQNAFAEDQALEQLLGNGYSQVLNPALQNQAGTFSTPTVPSMNLSNMISQIAKDATRKEWAVAPRGAMAGPGVIQQGFDPGEDLWDTVLAGTLGINSPYEELLAALMPSAPNVINPLTFFGQKNGYYIV